MLKARIEKALATKGFSLSQSEKLAASVKKLSDFFIENPENTTPWSESWAQVAYLVYYYPLNFIRFRSLLSFIPDFFSDVNHLTDFGSGLGSAGLALEEVYQLKYNKRPQRRMIEISSEAIRLHQLLEPEIPPINWKKDPGGELGVFSYSLTELSNPLPLLKKFKKIIVMEPSTSQDGRRLMGLRQELLLSGYSLVAPCPHQKHCPLLVHSQRDWCHHRIRWEMPDWFSKIEAHLPIKNKTLTYSFLVAQKQPLHETHKTRLIGDWLDEKGKFRQLMCRGPEREFLTWMKKNGPRPSFERGDLITLPENTKVANEVRLTSR